MDLDRLSTGEKIAGGSAVLLFIFMFFDWFKVEVSGAEGFLSVSAGGNAWEWFTWIDLFLMLTIIVVLVVVVVRLSDALFEPPVSLNAVAAVFGAISVLLVLYRIIDPPSSDELSGVGIEISRQLGVFLGFLAAAGITYGSYRAMQEEGTSFGEIGDQLSNRGPGAGPPQPPSSTPPSPPPPPPSS
jgi:hypothetical protein